MLRSTNDVLRIIKEHPEGITVGEVHRRARGYKSLHVEHIRPLRGLAFEPHALVLYSHEVARSISELIGKGLVKTLPNGKLTLTVLGQKVELTRRATRQLRYVGRDSTKKRSMRRGPYVVTFIRRSKPSETKVNA